MNIVDRHLYGSAADEIIELREKLLKDKRLLNLNYYQFHYLKAWVDYLFKSKKLTSVQSGYSYDDGIGYHIIINNSAIVMFADLNQICLAC